MDIAPDIMGYDRAIVIFSPDGRLFQVEYAREAVKKGTTAIGVVYNDGVVLITTMKKSNIIMPGEKIAQVDDHIGIASAGLVADARILVDMARMRAQQNRLVYDEPITIKALAKFLADRQQLYTQYAGVRPYGVSLLVGGYDIKPRMFETDPSGVMLEVKARSIGRYSDKINEELEKHYKKKMKLRDALKLAIDLYNKHVKEVKITKDTFFGVKIDESGFQEIPVKDLSEYGIKL